MPTQPQSDSPTSALALRPIHWVIGVALTVALAVAYCALYRDALNGYHDIAPVYAFAAIGVLCAGWWAGLLARWWQSRYGPSNNRWRGP